MEAYLELQADPAKPDSSPRNTFFTGKRRVNPAEVRVSAADNRTLVMRFTDKGEFEAGRCYTLSTSETLNSWFSWGAVTGSHQSKVCFSECNCDPSGTSVCEEGSGAEPYCRCKRHHAGQTCNECEEGFAKDLQTGQCRATSKCLSKGGQEDCGGHGQCIQDGAFAACKCYPGFANDGPLR